VILATHVVVGGRQLSPGAVADLGAVANLEAGRDAARAYA